MIGGSAGRDDRARSAAVGENWIMRRRSFITGAAATLAVPAVARGAVSQVLKFVPEADLSVLDPV